MYKVMNLGVTTFNKKKKINFFFSVCIDNFISQEDKKCFLRLT